MSPDRAASIRARLLNKAKATGDDFDLLLVRYGGERFLYRLSVSSVADRCILKGAGLLAVWMDDPYRATRDIDLLAAGRSDDAAIRELVAAVCAVPCDDGLIFEPDSIDVTPIRAEQQYEGQRAVVRAALARARIRLQIDFGFGDAVTPAPVLVDYPTLLPDVPAPRLKAYPMETTVAEKFEAMIRLGRTNSRMKDFHDVWALSSAFAFDGVTLRDAVAACFARRATAWSDEVPEVLRSAFFQRVELETSWRHYLASGAFHRAPPASFDIIGERVRGFLGPVREAIVAGTSFDSEWPAGGPWR